LNVIRDKHKDKEESIYFEEIGLSILIKYSVKKNSIVVKAK